MSDLERRAVYNKAKTSQVQKRLEGRFGAAASEVMQVVRLLS